MHRGPEFAAQERGCPAWSAGVLVPTVYSVVEMMIRMWLLARKLNDGE